jgi:hypothetical protein
MKHSIEKKRGGGGREIKTLPWERKQNLLEKKHFEKEK